MHYAVQSWTVSETFNRALVNMVSSNVSGVCRRRARGSRLRRDGQGRQGGPPASSARRCTNSRRRKRAWRSRGCDKLTRRAKFRLTRRANQWLNSRHPVPPEGRFAIVTDEGQGCGGRDGSEDERCRCVRRSREGLAPRCWCRFGGDKQSRSPGRSRISRKAIAQGRPDVLRCSCMLMRVFVC